MKKHLPSFKASYDQNSTSWYFTHGGEYGWVRYSELHRQFEQCVEFGISVSEKIHGTKISSNNSAYCYQIFIKLLAHCISILKISPSPSKKHSLELWDLSSSASLARCVMDAFDSLMYISACDHPNDEKNFRLAWFSLHDMNRRIQMLSLINSQHKEVAAMKQGMEKQLEHLMSFSQFKLVESSISGQVKSGKIPSHHIPPRKRFTEYGVEYSFYQAANVRLSQYVHTHSFSVTDLFSFEGGTEKSALSMSMPLQHSMAFLCRAIVEIHKNFPNSVYTPPSRTAAVISGWIDLSAVGGGWDDPYSSDELTDESG